MLNTEEEQFQKIYDKYKKLVLKVAFDMTKDYHMAQDICQETFMKLYGFQEHVDEDKVKSWLVVVASNLVRDAFKKGGKYKEFLDEEGLQVDLVEHENSIDRYLKEYNAREFHSRMLTSLRKKNVDWYETLVLVEYLEIPRKVVAKKSGVALSTIDLRLRRAKEWLIKNFKNEFEGL